jgi:hypothetical protein
MDLPESRRQPVSWVSVACVARSARGDYRLSTTGLGMGRQRCSHVDPRRRGSPAEPSDRHNMGAATAVAATADDGHFGQATSRA